MSKIFQMISIAASAKFSIDKPDNWDKMTLKEKKEYFWSHLESEASLCCHCSDGMESDFEALDEIYNDETWWDAGDFWDE